MNKDLSYIKEDIRALLISSDNGLSLHQLEKDYFKFNGSNIPYGRFGYNTLDSFLKSISDTVYVEGIGKYACVYPVVPKESDHIQYMVHKQKKQRKQKPRFKYKELMPDDASSRTSDYSMNRIRQEREWNPILLNAKKTKAPEVEIDYSIPSLPSTIAESFPADHLEVGALPRMDSDDDILFIGYPNEAIRLGRDIQFINNVSEATDSIDGLYLVSITYIRTPYKLWFQLKHDEGFEKMNYELQEYYENLTDDELLLHETDIREKRTCAARYRGTWYRGEIVSDELDQDGDYKIFCLDIGKVVRVGPKAIKFLMNEFGHIPRQAYRGRLASIQPKRMRWSRKVTQRLENLTFDKMLYAKIEHFDPDDQCHYLTLISTHAEDDVYINEYLATKYSDVLMSDVKGKVSVALKIPTFKMIEQGLTPLTSEFDD